MERIQVISYLNLWIQRLMIMIMTIFDMLIWKYYIKYIFIYQVQSLMLWNFHGCGKPVFYAQKCILGSQMESHKWSLTLCCFKLLLWRTWDICGRSCRLQLKGFSLISSGITQYLFFVNSPPRRYLLLGINCSYINFKYCT